MNFIRRRIVDPIIDLMRQGLSPEKLGLSLAFGITGGLFPIPGTTSIICAAFIYFFKLNLVATQVANLCMTPLDLALMIPFIKAGDFLLGSESFKGSTSDIKNKMSEDFFGFLGDFWIALLHGIFVWIIFAIAATYILYRIFVPLIANFQRRKDSLD